MTAGPGPREPVPPSWRLHLDGSVRVVDSGRVLIGGRPLRVLRLTAAGARTVSRWMAGAPVGTGPGGAALARRLLDAGVAHPVPDRGAFSPADVTLVLPTRGRAPGVEALLAVARQHGLAATVVVDDGSDPAEAAALRQACARHGAVLVCHPAPRGPGAARNRGAAEAATPVVAFLDSDCRWPPGPSWLEACLAHLGDPAVGLVAPRVRAAPGRAPAWLAAYESARSPLDLGTRPSVVRPGTQVPYVPAAALVVRREAFAQVGGFRTDMPVGEDVDLVWRMGREGWTSRYQPEAAVEHETRPGLGSWARQRYHYGTSAAPLDAAHPGSLVPLRISPWTALAWVLAVGGRPLAGLGVAATATGLLAPRLGELEHPWREALRLAGPAQVGAWRPLSEAVRRTWWPLLVPAAVFSHRARRLALAAAVGPPLVEAAGGVPLDPLRWAALRLADDLSYGAGVWAGMVRHRRLGPVLPARAR